MLNLFTKKGIINVVLNLFLMHNLHNLKLKV
jgi:hypothetical protein